MTVQALFERAGVPCTFVGHPSLEDDGVPFSPARRAELAAELRVFSLQALDLGAQLRVGVVALA